MSRDPKKRLAAQPTPKKGRSATPKPPARSPIAAAEPAGDPLDVLKTDAADLAAAPAALLGYQQRWVADQSPLKIAEKSRRIGLTWAEASDDVLTAATEGGSNVFYIGPTEDMALEYIEACAMWARAFDHAASSIEAGLFEDVDENGDSKHIKLYRITFPGSRKRIVALSSRPTNLRGKQGVVVIDESAFHPDLKGLIKAAMAMLLWGDKVRIISTHNGLDNQFNELIQEVRAGKRKGSVHRITFRQAIAEGLYKRVCLRRGTAWTAAGEAEWVADAYNYYGDDADEELDVVPSQSGGAYLPLALIELRMSPHTPLVRGKWKPEFSLLPEDVRALEVEEWCEEHLAPVLTQLSGDFLYSFGEDFGRIADLTVLPILEEGRDLIKRCRLWVELSGCPFKQQEQILSYIVERLPRFRSGAMDATGNGAALAEYAADQWGHTRVEQVKLNDTFYLENMPKFKAAFEDGTIDCIPRDREIRDDLRALRRIDGIPKLPRGKTQKADGEKKTQRHGDGAVALFLADYAARRNFVPIEGESTGDARAGNQLADYLE